MILHEKISAQLPAWRERMKALVKDHGDVVVDNVTVGQIVGGMRDVKSLLTDVSYVDPAQGIRFRGMSIPEVLAALPKARGGKLPLVGGLYYLLDGWRGAHQGAGAGGGSRMGCAFGAAGLRVQDAQGDADRHAPHDSPDAVRHGPGTRFAVRPEVPCGHEEGCILGAGPGGQP